MYLTTLETAVISNDDRDVGGPQAANLPMPFPPLGAAIVHYEVLVTLIEPAYTLAVMYAEHTLVHAKVRLIRPFISGKFLQKPKLFFVLAQRMPQSPSVAADGVSRVSHSIRRCVVSRRLVILSSFVTTT